MVRHILRSVSSVSDPYKQRFAGYGAIQSSVNIQPIQIRRSKSNTEKSLGNSCPPLHSQSKNFQLRVSVCRGSFLQICISGTIYSWKRTLEMFFLLIQPGFWGLWKQGFCLMNQFLAALARTKFLLFILTDSKNTSCLKLLEKGWLKTHTFCKIHSNCFFSLSESEEKQSNIPPLPKSPKNLPTSSVASRN